MSKGAWVATSILVILIIGGSYWAESHNFLGGPAAAIVGAHTIKIGGLFALSGGGAYWGEDEMRAVRLAIDEANATGGIHGTPIELVAEDAPAAENTSKGVGAFQKLVSVDQVSAVIGPTWDLVAQALAPLADETKTVLISPSTSSGGEGAHDYQFFFSTALPEYQETLRMAQYLKKNGLTRIGIIGSNDPYSLIIGAKLKQAAQTTGLSIEKEIVATNLVQTDFRTEIAEIKEQPIDALYIVFADESSKCPFLKEAKELRFDKPIISTLSTESPDSLSKCAQVMEGIHYTYPKQGPKYETLLAKYRAAYHMDPTSPATANAYDAASLLIDEMRAGHISGEDLREALLNIHDFSGVTGDNISFSSNGYFVLPSEDFEIKTVKNGQFVVVE